MSAEQLPRDEPASHGAAAQQTAETPALVPLGGHFEGQIAVVGETRVDGSVRGALRGPGMLVLGPGARVEGTVDCASLDNSGEINGTVTVYGRARLGPGARLEGRLEAPILEVDNGALWNGTARVGDAEARPGKRV